MDRCRFCRLYAISLVVMAASMGAVLTVQFSIGLNELGGHGHAWRAVSLSALRSIAPAVSGSALLLALLLWAHPLPRTTLSEQLPSILRRGVLVSLPGFLVAALLIVSSSIGTGLALYSLPISALSPAIRQLGPLDVATGIVATLADALLIVLLARRGLPALEQRRLSLPAKLAIALPVSFVLRSLLGLLLPTIG